MGAINREQLEHAIRAAAQLTEIDRLIVIGSQSVLGTWSEEELPYEATMSREVDILPLAGADTQRLAEKLGELGEMSLFDQTHGFHIDGVDETTAVLPRGWQDRLVRVDVYSVVLGREIQGLCLDPHDLCIAKLVAHRTKDRSFVAALMREKRIDPNLLLERLSETTPSGDQDLGYVFAWLLEHVPPSRQE